MDIDISKLPHSTRERLEHHQRLADKAARCAEFRRLATTDPKRAGAYLLAATAYEHLGMLQELEGSEVVEFCRASSAKVRAAILAAHPNPVEIRVALLPTDQVPAWVLVRVNGALDTGSQQELSARDAARLAAAGLGHRVERRQADRPCGYRGTRLEGAAYFSADVWDLLVGLDQVLARHVESGAVTVEPLDDRGNRQRLLAGVRSGDVKLDEVR